MTIGDVKNINDAPIGGSDFRPPVDRSVTPSEGDILTFDASLNSYVPRDGITTQGYRIEDDAGDGSVADDCNNTDFTDQGDISDNTVAEIPLSAVTTFVHKAVSYNWVGPTDVTVGIGGSYIAQPTDFTGIGTADHANLVGIDQPNQHPTSAITGLDDDQTAQDDATAQVQTNLSAHMASPPNSHTTASITGLDAKQQSQDAATAGVQSNLDAHMASPPDSHTTSSITGLDTKQNLQDNATALVQTNLNTHLADASDECHAQYATRADALATFTAAGYGGIGVDAGALMADIGATWQNISGYDLFLIDEPRGITYALPNDGIRFNAEGIWQVTVKVSLVFVEVNAGRQLSLRMFNVDIGASAGISFNFFVGRNQAGANLNFTLAAHIPAASVGDLAVLQVSSAADSFTGVTNIGTVYQAIHVSEAKFLEDV